MRSIITILAMLVCANVSAQYKWLVGGSASTSIGDTRGIVCVDKVVCNGLSLGGELEVWDGFADLHGIVGFIGNISPRDEVSLRAGIGLGHHFTKEQTDHNYHTYHLGFMYRRWIWNRIALNIEPHWWARDWQGNLVNKGELRLSAGVTFYIGNKTK